MEAGGVMTDAEYIRTTDLCHVRHIKDGLRQIVPANNPDIPEAEFHQVARLVHGWEERMEAKREALEDTEDPSDLLQVLRTAQALIDYCPAMESPDPVRQEAMRAAWREFAVAVAIARDAR